VASAGDVPEKFCVKPWRPGMLRSQVRTGFQWQLRSLQFKAASREWWYLGQKSVMHSRRHICITVIASWSLLGTKASADQ